MELIAICFLGILFVNFVLPLFECILSLINNYINFTSAKINLKIIKLQKDYGIDLEEETQLNSAIGFDIGSYQIDDDCDGGCDE